jgi:hypothetical protein
LNKRSFIGIKLKKEKWSKVKLVIINSIKFIRKNNAFKHKLSPTTKETYPNAMNI